MENNTLFDWLFDWKTGFSWGFGCIGLALWLLLYSVHRELSELKRQTVRIAEGVEKLAERQEK
jgi:hypothetical protein